MNGKRRRVVITGLGVVAPNGHGLVEFETALRERKSGIRTIAEMAELNFACRVGGVPQGALDEAPSYFSEEELLSMNEVMIYAGMAAIDAWKDANLCMPSPGDDNVSWETGAIVGLGVSGMDTLVNKVIPGVRDGRVRRLGSTTVEQVMSSSVSAKLSGIFGLGNEVTTNSSACNTGSEAVILAYDRIRSGRADRMVAGSVEGSSAYLWAGFDSMKVLCTKFNDEPERASRPMSATAGGFIPGSGSGILILEELETALSRGARIYAEIIGGFVNSGGHRMGGSMTAPNRTSVQRCIRGALADAGIPGSAVDAINGHLTGTFADPYELENWAIALDCADQPKKLPPIQATKSMIGHGLGAAGGMECVATVLQLSRGFLHGSLNCEDLHEQIKPFEASVVRATRDAEPQIFAKAGFGFGDVNGCVLFKKFEGNNNV